MCFVTGNLGTSVPIHGYFECVGANIANIMVSCDTRPCKTALSEEIVCHNLNSTSFILASAKEFDLKIHCKDKISVAKINKVTLLRVPHSCWELEKIILTAKGFSFTDEMSVSDHLSISANVIGGVTIALFVMVFIMHAWKKYFGKKHQDKKKHSCLPL